MMMTAMMVRLIMKIAFSRHHHQHHHHHHHRRLRHHHHHHQIRRAVHQVKKLHPIDPLQSHKAFAHRGHTGNQDDENRICPIKDTK